MPTPDTVYQGSDSLKLNCTASSQYSASYKPEEAWNGITETGASADAWMSNNASEDQPNANGQCWIQVDLTETKTDLSSIRLNRRGAGGTNNFPKDIELLVSDTGSFSGEETSLGTAEVDDAAVDGWSDWVFPGAQADGRYLRIEIHSMWESGTPGDWVMIQEIEIGAGGSPEPPTERILTLDRKAILIGDEQIVGRITGEDIKGLSVAEVETMLGATATPTASKLAKWDASKALASAWLTDEAGSAILGLYSLAMAASATAALTLNATNDRAIVRVMSVNGATVHATFFVSGTTITTYQTGAGVAIGTSGTDPATSNKLNIWFASGQLQFNNLLGFTVNITVEALSN